MLIQNTIFNTGLLVTVNNIDTYSLVKRNNKRAGIIENTTAFSSFFCTITKISDNIIAKKIGIKSAINKSCVSSSADLAWN